nr:DUF4419 domain-containing protein [Armatimonas sp.]
MATIATTVRIPGNSVLQGLLPLKTVTYEVVLKQVLGGGGELEAFSRNTKTLITPEVSSYSHGFVAAVSAAYNKHHPLVLSPDMIWLLIAQGFALHVRENAEVLREKLVAHHGKLTLEVRRDDFVKGFAGNDWEGVFAEFSEQIRTHLSDATHQTIVPSFSTTGIIEKAAFEVALLDAMQVYFNYDVIGICGIPYFILEGTPDDWQQLRQHTAALAEFDLEWWVMPLLRVLDEFVAASQGNPTREFWQEFYMHSKCRGVPYICGEPFFIGHLANFFPYLTAKKPLPGSFSEQFAQKHPGLYTSLTYRSTILGKRIGKAYVVNRTTEYGTSRHYHFEPDQFGQNEGIRDSSLPTGISVAPFTWRTQTTQHSMEFAAGFVGASQDRKTRAVRPEIGWAVRHASLPRTTSA